MYWIATLTPEQLSTYPLHAPPDGVLSNFSNTAENNNKPLIVVTSFVLAVMLIFYTNRIYTKACIVRRFSWDDCQLCAPKAPEGNMSDHNSDHHTRICTCRKSLIPSPAHLSLS